MRDHRREACSSSATSVVASPQAHVLRPGMRRSGIVVFTIGIGYLDLGFSYRPTPFLIAGQERLTTVAALGNVVPSLSYRGHRAPVVSTTPHSGQFPLEMSDCLKSQRRKTRRQRNADRPGKTAQKKRKVIATCKLDTNQLSWKWIT